MKTSDKALPARLGTAGLFNQLEGAGLVLRRQDVLREAEPIHSGYYGKQDPEL